MANKIPMDQNRRSIPIREGGVGVSGRGSRLGGGFDLSGGAVEIVQSLGFLTSLVVINARDAAGNHVSITLLPDDAERVAGAITGVAGAIEGR